LDSSSTELERGDYLFLQRFLDVTKANLFFAQGVILVEGDAENILMPTIAEIIGKPLSKHGVSIVNVNSTAFLRYSRIFRRKDVAQGQMSIPVAVVTDCDIMPNSSTADEIKRNRAEKEARYNGQGVKTFISPVWTLEYDICLSGLKGLFYKAVLRAEKIQNSNQIGLTDEKIKEVDNKVQSDFDSWKIKSDQEIANEIYVSYIKDKDISKAIVAQNFAGILKNEDRETLKSVILKDQHLKYLVDAIQYACG
jgi:putative ATP-dependent endonuclease of OLD family